MPLNSGVKPGLIICIIMMLLLALNLFAIEKKGKGKAKEKEMEISKDKENIVTLDNLTWLAGHWEGEAFGGVCEEVWNLPSGSSMVGTFKLISGGQVQFYEIMIITADSSGLVLRLKHFNADLSGWEEKDKVITFPFVRASDNMIQFDGLVYERSPDDILKIVVDMKQADGSVSQEVIESRLIED